MSKVRILNVDIDNLTQRELLDSLDKGILLTPNVDDLVKNQRDEEFHRCVKRATHIVCDSKIVLRSSQFLGNSLKEAIPGSSFFPAFYTYHAKNENMRIFLLGAKEGVGEVAMTKINEKVKRNIVVGTYSPSFGFENNPSECEKILHILRTSSANVLVVGLGNPKQTKWIFDYKDKLPNIDLFMALGATIDFEAGNIKRAPRIFQMLCIEWFYRFIKEPKRLWKRYFIDDIPFFYFLIRQKFRMYNNPFPERSI